MLSNISKNPTVFKDNHNARGLYKSFAFLPTGEIWGEEDVFFLSIN
jgi:diamine N-acetyltransferase